MGGYKFPARKASRPLWAERKIAISRPTYSSHTNSVLRVGPSGPALFYYLELPRRMIAGRLEGTLAEPDLRENLGPTNWYKCNLF